MEQRLRALPPWGPAVVVHHLQTAPRVRGNEVVGGPCKAAGICAIGLRSTIRFRSVPRARDRGRSSRRLYVR